jgi:hypothetical protein
VPAPTIITAAATAPNAGACRTHLRLVMTAT